jgi:hypothetical protein
MECYGHDECTGIAVSIVTGFESWQGHDIILYCEAFTPTLDPTKIPIQWVLCLSLKRPGREADASPHTFKVKNGGFTHPLPQIASWPGT